MLYSDLTTYIESLSVQLCIRWTGSTNFIKNIAFYFYYEISVAGKRTYIGTITIIHDGEKNKYTSKTRTTGEVSSYFIIL